MAELIRRLFALLFPSVKHHPANTTPTPRQRRRALALAITGPDIPGVEL